MKKFLITLAAVLISIAAMSQTEEKVYDVVEQMPTYPGGKNALMQFLATNIKYPVEAEENGIQGRVICSFIVERDGSISGVKVVVSVDPLLDKEAVRAVSSMPKWNPGKQKGSAVRVKYVLPITFRLNDISKTIDGVCYLLSGKDAKVIIGKNEYTGSVTIPETVTYGNLTYNVTEIGDFAFNGCPSLTSVTIPNSVKSIGGRAFCGCSGLTSVTIPNSVTTIGQSAFSGCSSLTSLTIPNSVTEIGSYAFEDCKGLKGVTIPSNVTSIGSGAFSDCSGLTSVTIPNSVTSIKDGAFSGCSSLTSLTIPNSVTSIGDMAFRDCSGLTSVTIPKSVTLIGNGIIINCPNLTSIVVESGNPRYDSRDNCNAIIDTETNTLIAGCKNTVIPENVIVKEMEKITTVKFTTPVIRRDD